jgi:protein-tyrosine-phosphatase
MREKGIDIGGQKPKPMDDGLVKIADRIITMGCIRGCPVNPPEKTEDWNLPDPGGKPVETFREVRDRIEEKVRILITELKLRSGS